ncbi:pimeloyl-[acyl-carrier protein] methyl ester esterase [Thiomicrorhabdus immobilis]|uniref:Pimeloyl-[acyl-carrier protein] methyl ester esterase n=1 Tax=Thiomicrorhabdus immobilis TaxID=2791037 RepID=A0ABN6CTX0_9GAMM|nr:pimeloyl-ACP methyl ester esterase BioH [Thiomicrorhabdus immobilis]BCN92393.1 pimeloyl-[acyl-carrier protein] methyl ester esterase [Thiomicrorhabdus immobilis]
MKLNTLVIPSFDEHHQPNPNLTLIHGWGAESRVWESWATEKLGKDYSLTLIDLPGYGDSPALANSHDIQADWIQAIVDAMPEKTHLLGWSLGGLLAQQIALQHPDRVLSLICLATTPRFTQNDGWQRSVSPQIIGDFIQAISIEVSGVLKKFWRLQLQGSANSRALMKALGEHMSTRKLPGLVALNQGLILLKDMDNRAQLKQLTMPTFWLLGECDPLIPQEIRENLGELQPDAQIQVIPGGSHIPFFSQPDETAEYILKFLTQA